MQPKCACSSCRYSESLKDDFKRPYRYVPGTGQKIFHLSLHFSVPIVGAFLIGLSWLALVPFAGFLVTYVVNSFLFCPGCSYHHENAELCGCFPRSVFSYKRYKPWGKTENILGWPLIIILSVCPTLTVLYLQGNFGAMVFFLAYFAVGLVIHALVSCPECRQRGICYLGKEVIFLK